MLLDLLTAVRIGVASILLCVVGYGTAVLATAAVMAPLARRGELVTVDGVPVGARRVGQSFARAEYIWPRPSAVAYAADAASGSNLSPANPAVRERARSILDRLGATADRPAPADLVLASGSGLDPHITEAAALYQAERVAEARQAPHEHVRTLIAELAEAVGPGSPERIVNVLLLNIELDRRFPTPRGGDNVPAGSPGG